MDGADASAVMAILLRKNIFFQSVEYQLLVPHTVARLQSQNYSIINYIVYSSSRNERLDFILTFM